MYNIYLNTSTIKNVIFLIRKNFKFIKEIINNKFLAFKNKENIELNHNYL